MMIMMLCQCARLRCVLCVVVRVRHVRGQKQVQCHHTTTTTTTTTTIIIIMTPSRHNDCDALEHGREKVCLLLLEPLLVVVKLQRVLPPLEPRLILPRLPRL